jgi:hypothetical protein
LAFSVGTKIDAPFVNYSNEGIDDDRIVERASTANDLSHGCLCPESSTIWTG